MVERTSPATPRPEVAHYLAGTRDAAAAWDPARATPAGDHALALAFRAALRRPPGATPFAARVEDVGVGTVPLRVYRPHDDHPARPVLVFFHGGGWVAGDLETNDEACRTIAVRAGCVVVSVAYGLAPEHHYPGPLDDCWDSVAWVRRSIGGWGGDPDRLAVGGSSAGGNLAAAVAIRARVAGVPLQAQLLLYPVIDPGLGTASMDRLREGYGLTARQLRFLWHCYLDGHPAGTPEISPLLVDPAGLPPAVVVTAELDPLRDEGEAYAEHLRSAGVPVDLRRYRGQIHGFVGLPGVTPDAQHCLVEVSDRLAELWATSGSDTPAFPNSIF